jgi:hypothetical protein
MPTRSRLRAGSTLAAALVLSCAQPPRGIHQDPLPSWNDTGAKKAIVAFVERVITEGSPDFVPVPERIATFDNDGTLWSEKPVPLASSSCGPGPNGSTAFRRSRSWAVRASSSSRPATARRYW